MNSWKDLDQGESMHLFALISQQSELETCWAANNRGLLGAQFPPQNIHLNTECGLLSS